MKRITKKIALLLSAVCIFIMVQVPGMEVQAAFNDIIEPEGSLTVEVGKTNKFELKVKNTHTGKKNITVTNKDIATCTIDDKPASTDGDYNCYWMYVTGKANGETDVNISIEKSEHDKSIIATTIKFTVTPKSAGKDDSSGNTDTSGQQSSQGQGASGQQSSTDKDGSSSTSPEETNTSTSASASTTSDHTHNYTWVTVQEATKLQDGLEEYKCDCGMVEERSVIPSSQVYVKELYGKLKDAAENGTVTFDSGKLYTISDYIIKKLQDRNDVTTVIDFEYNQAKYRMTIPAGVDYTKLLEDQDYFYGYFFFANEVGATIENSCEDL